VFVTGGWGQPGWGQLGTMWTWLRDWSVSQGTQRLENYWGGEWGRGGWGQCDPASGLDG